MRLPSLERSRHQGLFVLSALGLCLTSWVVGATAGPAPTDLLALGVTLDLVLGFPLLGYLFLVRPGATGWGVMAPLAVVGFLVSRVLLAGPGSLVPTQVEWPLLIVVVEGMALLLVATRVRRIRTGYLGLRGEAPFPSDALRQAFRDTLGARLGSVAFGEAAVVWYALTGWGRRAEPSPGSFDAPGPTGQGALVGVLSLLIVVETLALHLLLHLWDPRVAWLATLSSLYGILWLVADRHASRITPTRLDARGIHVRAGLRWRVDVPWEALVAVHESDPGCESLSTAFLRSPDLWIEMREPMRVEGPLGLARPARVLGLSVGDRSEMRTEIVQRIGPPGETPDT